MAIPFKINKAKYDGLSDEMKSEYIAGDKDGEYVLDVSGLPSPEDTGPLKRALESERTRNKTLKTENDGLKTQIAEMPDIEALTETHKAEVKKYKDFTESSLIDGTAMALASKISTVPGLMAKAIKERLVTDLTGDKPVTKVLKDGKASDMTLEQLGEEFVANAEYKGIIIASKASGGGTPPRTPNNPANGGGTPPNGNEQAADFSKMKGAELAAHLKAKKEAAAANVQQ